MESSSYYHPKQQYGTREVRLRRWASYGDVIAATSVARKLHDLGATVIFETNAAEAEVLRGCPYIAKVTSERTVGVVNLDNAYEAHPYRRSWHFHRIFMEVAAKQLNEFKLSDCHNVAPLLWVGDNEIAMAEETMGKFPKPWVVVVPRSNSFTNKTVPRVTWSHLPKLVGATCFWSGTELAPPGFVDLKCNHIRSVMAFIARADVVVSVDTGPMHIAAALKKPLVTIGQASDPALHLSDQRNFMVVYPDLECLNCQEAKCPLAEIPPCIHIPIDGIATAVRARIDSVYLNKISAIICVYKANVKRLNRCLEAVLPQVDEVIIAVDGDDPLPNGVKKDRKIKVVPPAGPRLGYGRTANRGARASNGRWLLMLNDDAFVEPETVSKLMEAVDVKTAVVGAQLWYPDGTLQHGGTGRRPGDIGWGHLDWRKKEPSITQPKEMEFVTLAVALVRREAFYRVEGYDESYKNYYEDGDLCLKLRRDGWRVMYQPHAKAIHEEAQTTSIVKEDKPTENQEIFQSRWGWFFKRNPDTQLGTFP